MKRRKLLTLLALSATATIVPLPKERDDAPRVIARLMRGELIKGEDLYLPNGITIPFPAPKSAGIVHCNIFTKPVAYIPNR